MTTPQAIDFTPALLMCSAIAVAIITSDCGVLNIHARLASIGSMIRDECVTDKDCYHGTCATGGTCVPNELPDTGGGGDPGPGDPGAGDP